MTEFPTSSRHSIISPETSSVGPSRSGYKTLFDQLHWRSSWPPTVGGDQPAFFEATIGDERGLFFWANQPKEEAWKQAVGCALIFALPAVGLDEALQSLWEIREFHIGSPMVGLPAAQPTLKRSVGTAVGSRDRAPFVLEG